MKILITGAGGMLGTDLVQALGNGFEVVGTGRRPAPHLAIPYACRDLSQRDEAFQAVQNTAPDLIFHLAAMTQVDACESRREEALRCNEAALRHVAAAAEKKEIPLVFFSTDFVFDGKAEHPYTEEERPKPVNFYGETKCRAEQYLHLRSHHFVIFRISWLFGVHGRSFPRKILEMATKQDTLEVVQDQFGRPTYSRDVARALAGLLAKDAQVFHQSNRETFHLANEGTTSWAEFAAEILRQAGYDKHTVTGISSDRLARPAARPLKAVLDTGKIERVLGVRLRSWQDALPEFIQELKQDNK